MPITARERQRIMRMGQHEPIPRETTSYVKRILMGLIDDQCAKLIEKSDDDERDVIRVQRARIAKLLGVR